MSLRDEITTIKVGRIYSNVVDDWLATKSEEFVTEFIELAHDRDVMLVALLGLAKKHGFNYTLSAMQKWRASR